jgi:O-antigen/teichoic acid export membrane protein
LLSEFWACGRWAIFGSFVTFLTSNTYPYLAAISFSKSEVADISVARLLSMPIALMGAAWSNLMRARLSQWAADHQYGKLDLTVRKSVFAAAMLSILVGIVVYFFGDLIRFLFGEKYANLRILTLLWTAQTGLAFIKGIYAATLMTGDTGFRDLSHIGVITLATTGVVMLIASTTPYSESIVLALAFLELVQIGLIQRKRHHMQVQRCPVSN